MSYIAHVSNLIFSLGFYIYAVLYMLQLYRILKSKSVKGVSLYAHLGFLFMTGNAIIYSIFFNHLIWVPAFAIGFIINITICFLFLKY
jgi:hypothetical protein